MTHIVKKRWCWNADRTRLVPETSAEAAWLAYTPGAEIPDAEARTSGLLSLDGAAPDPVTKPVDPPTDKARRPAGK